MYNFFMDLFGMEKLSLVDYDGFVAATVFTGSCNFRCGFCHNSALVFDYKTLQKIDENEVLSYLEKRKGVLEGLCITGGEPTLNKDLPLFAEKVKKIGYAVKVDTNGTNPDMVKTLAENGLCDYFAVDIKNDLENYAAIIGFDKFDTSKIERTVEYLISGKISYEFRTTLISEFHKAENLTKIAEWISGAKKYFLQKFKGGDNCIAADNLSPVPTETAKLFAEIAAKRIKKVALRGYDL
ncbi:MAG: anaerobic ribonucleoside-triphosphate reductase activating protein [Clostridia bacterium]|nr:anaerobic ribonucleoside-triphosphate reductase activating protein [Clostridia bacterium]